MKFYICKHCGNLVKAIRDAGVPMTCCGEHMSELVPNTVEAAKEKHLPVVSVDGGKVSVAVGSVFHPMLDEHSIEWVYLETENGGQQKVLRPGSAPEVVFLLENDKALAAYAYCNLHGLWKVVI